MRRPILAPLAIAAALLVPAAAPAGVAAAEPDFPASMSGYHNYPEMVAEIQQAAADHPGIVSVFSIGKSYQGRDIWAAKVSDNVADDEAEPEVLIDALHHAREHLTTEQALAVLRWLTDDYGADETVTRLVDSREVFIVFALNPDGMRFDLTGTPFRAWRKNRQPNAGSTAVGTDINRNYAYRWGCCNGSSGTKSSITYRGPKPFSAPETRAIRDFVNSRVVGGLQQIRTHITLHTNGKLILWPYGYTKKNTPPDMAALDQWTFGSLGRAMAALNGYAPLQSSDLYITDGDQIDWMYGVHRIFSFTFELYPPETSTVWGDHYPDDSTIGPQTDNNRGAILLLIDRAACPYATLSEGQARANCGPLYDDLEINRGWRRNPFGTDTAVRGLFAVANPEPTNRDGAKQLGTTVSGRNALVTGAAAGRTAAYGDIDGGVTSIRSRRIALPADPAEFGNLTFRYYLAHRANATSDDWLRVIVEAEDGTQTVVAEVLGTPNDNDAAWASASVSLADWAGQAIRLIVAAQDGGSGSLVEAAVDDIRIRRP
ncbi:MAG: M14 family zinc carboxypeptidase [Chloroflexota bacterium]